MKFLADQVGAAIEVDSAGTAGYHNGSGPDPRSAAEALRHGIDISGQQSRQVHAGDFVYFDLLIAMDESNLTSLTDMAPTEEAAAKVRRLREFDPATDCDLDVPDPYYEDGFDGVFTMVERSCAELLDRIQAGDFES